MKSVTAGCQTSGPLPKARPAVMFLPFMRTAPGYCSWAFSDSWSLPFRYANVMSSDSRTKAFVGRD